MKSVLKEPESTSVRLPAKGQILKTWDESTVVLGEATFFSSFAAKIGGREVNGRGLAMSWDQAVTEVFPKASAQFKDGLFDLFSNAITCLSIQPGIIKAAEEFLLELYKEEKIETGRNLDLRRTEQPQASLRA